jgi:hypothetical protein
MGTLKDRVGQRYGRLVVIEKGESLITPKGKQVTRWVCQCDCGKRTLVVVDSLRKGVSKSCGCLNRELNTTHGMSKSSTYQVWEGMKRRCNDKNHPSFSRYSAVGYDPAWELFENFYKDMGDRPEGLTLDRIENSLGYCKSNCRWATQTVQSHNKVVEHSTEFTGVHYYKATGKYQSYIAKDGVKYHLGYFDTPEEAAKARDEKAKELYGDFCSLNFK